MSFQTSNFTETLYKSIPGQVNVNQAQGLVECFVAALGNKDSVGDICLPGCFSSSLKRRKPRVVWGHNWNEPIGKVLEIYEVGPNDPRLPAKMREKRVGGLFARVQFNLAAEKGREAFANVAFFGEEQEWSIGYKTLDAVFDSSQQANLLKEVELYEVSPVLHGANQLTATLSIKSDEQKAADSGPCWPGYEQLGMKPGKDGKMVPNCIPIDGSQKSADEPLKDPDGGLTAAGRKYFKRTEGANLKPGVKGPANTPEKMRRKGSFLTRFFTNPSGPMVGDDGKPTRLALSAAAWGEPVPKNAQDAAKLAQKGRNLLKKYSNAKEFPDNEEEKFFWGMGRRIFKKTDEIIYSPGEVGQNPIAGRMGALAKNISIHFGGEIVIRSAEENIVVFDLTRDGHTETLRGSYHTPNGVDFMFGAATPVRAEVVYMPINDSHHEEHEESHGSCGCGGACGGQKSDCACGGECGGSCGISTPMASWNDFKSENPGIHMFIKSDDIESFEAANEIGFHHGFTVELLSDGFAIPNIDWYGNEASNAVVSALDALEKALPRQARQTIGGARAAVRVEPAKYDGDSDGFVTGPTGLDNLPAPRKIAPRMPKTDEPIEVPEKVPEKTPIPRPVPSRPSTPAPAPSRPVPERVPQRLPASFVEKPRPMAAAGGSGGEPPDDPFEKYKNNRMPPMSPKKLHGRKSEIYVSISESADLHVKSGFQFETQDLDAFLFPIDIQNLFEAKSCLEEVARYHSIKSLVTEDGIKILGVSQMSNAAIDATTNLLSNWAE
jgi:hypothetical protein